MLLIRQANDLAIDICGAPGPDLSATDRNNCPCHPFILASKLNPRVFFVAFLGITRTQVKTRSDAGDCRKRREGGGECKGQPGTTFGRPERVTLVLESQPPTRAP